MWLINTSDGGRRLDLGALSANVAQLSGRGVPRYRVTAANVNSP